MELTLHEQPMTVTRRLAYLALFLAYAQIVFGAVVRITDSGMGCGDHWPKCNGRWIPEFTVPTLIEWMHRLLAISFGFVFLALIAMIWVNRRNARFNGTDGLAFPVYLIVPLALVQAQQEGRLKPGMIVMLVAFGAGFTWGSVVLRW